MALGDADDARHGLARVVVRISRCQWVTISLKYHSGLFLLDRDPRSTGVPVDIHHHELRVEGVVVIGVVPVDPRSGARSRPGRRHRCRPAALIARLLDLRVVEMQLAVPGKRCLDRRGQRENAMNRFVGVEPRWRSPGSPGHIPCAHPCLRRLSCTFLKKSKYASHVFGMSLDLENQPSPPAAARYGRGRRLPLKRHAVGAALLGDVVVGLSGQQRGLAEQGLLGVHDVADVDPPVLPAVYLQDLGGGC